MKEHPLNDIENAKANHDLGRMAAQVFKGALEESDTWAHALWATIAFFAGMFRSQSNESNDRNNEGETDDS